MEFACPCSPNGIYSVPCISPPHLAHAHDWPHAQVSPTHDTAGFPSLSKSAAVALHSPSPRTATLVLCLVYCGLVLASAPVAVLAIAYPLLFSLSFLPNHTTPIIASLSYLSAWPLSSALVPLSSAAPTRRLTSSPAPIETASHLTLLYRRTLERPTSLKTLRPSDPRAPTGQ